MIIFIFTTESNRTRAKMSVLKLISNSIKHSCTCYHGNCPLNLRNELNMLYKYHALRSINGFALQNLYIHGSALQLWNNNRYQTKNESAMKARTQLPTKRFIENSSGSHSFLSKRNQSANSEMSKTSESDKAPAIPEAALDWAYLTDPANLESIRASITHRKGVGDIDKVVSIILRLDEWHIISSDIKNLGKIWSNLLI